MYVIFITLFNAFDKQRGKYAKPDLVKFISLEINYFITSCFLFLGNIDSLLFQVTKISFPSPFFFLIFYSLYFSLSLCFAWQLLLDF